MKAAPSLSSDTSKLCIGFTSSLKASLDVASFAVLGTDSFLGLREVRHIDCRHLTFCSLLLGRALKEHPLDTTIYERILGWIEKVV